MLVQSVNIFAYNITNSLVSEILSKKRESFVLLRNKLKNRITEINKLYRDGSGLYSHADILSKKLHNPFILEKTCGDFYYWISEINQIVMDLMTNVSNYVQNDNDDPKAALKTFKNTIYNYANNLPNTFKLKKTFLDQAPKNANYDEMSLYEKKAWTESLDSGINMCEMTLSSLDKLILMIDLLEGHVKKLAIYSNKNPEKAVNASFDKTGVIGDFILYEIKIIVILKVALFKMSDYSIIRFSDLLKASNLIKNDLSSIKGELWR